MPLNGAQTEQLVTALAEEWDLQRLGLLAKDLEVNLANLAPNAPMPQAALTLVTELNTALPPRDILLLDRLAQEANPRLRLLAQELLAPVFFPPGDPRHAIVLGKTAFVNRAPLRDALAAFTTPSAYTTHVLVVRGETPCGKSYTWEFLRHLAMATGATPQRLALKNAVRTPRELFEAVFGLLGLDLTTLPQMTDEPQLARIDPLIWPLKGQLQMMQGRRYWLVIDDLNHESVAPEVGEAAFAIARSIEEIRPDRLWVALLGYNAPISDNELRWVAQEDAQFPDPSCLAEHLHAISSLSSRPLTKPRARKIAQLLFSPYATVDKAAMIELTPIVEAMGEKLRSGVRP